MRSPPSHCFDADETPTLGSAEALMAGTLALMTGFAQAEGAQAQAMARKIADNLQALARCETLSAPMRQMLMRLTPRWQQAASGLTAGHPARDPARWLHSPAALQ